MPFSGGTAGAHTDAMHQGNAKRDVAEGVAGLEADGDLLVPGANLVITRNGSDEIELHERTSGEIFARWVRVGVNDYTQWLRVGTVATEVLHAAMKDAANGVAGLDASALLSEAVFPGILNKYLLSGALLHSFNDIRDTSTTSPVKTHTITVDSLYPSPSTIRVSVELVRSGAAATVYVQIYKNGSPVGVSSQTSGASVSLTQDLSFAEGDTIEAWGWSSVGGTNARISNFRVYGDNHLITLGEAITDSEVGVATPFAGTNS